MYADELKPVDRIHRKPIPLEYNCIAEESQFLLVSLAKVY